mmetsp:Transcript_12093/g.25413  ORF Transcript_12093/g.25413 Transcript_12093/m.25413 type:complete len:211 (+) Transcript_12093:695-1327(+)
MFFLLRAASLLRMVAIMFVSFSSMASISLSRSSITWSCSLMLLESSTRLHLSLPDSSFSFSWSLYIIQWCVKLAPITEMGRARMMTEASMVREATIRPKSDRGTASPYPTVISVTMHHQKLAGMERKWSSSPSSALPLSQKYISVEKKIIDSSSRNPSIPSMSIESITAVTTTCILEKRPPSLKTRKTRASRSTRNILVSTSELAAASSK